MFRKIEKFYKKNDKKTLWVYVILRVFVIVSMIFQFLHGNFQNVFYCLLTLLLFTIPYIITKRFNITLPNTLEIIILLFIFSAEILGEIQNFYGIIPHWDTMLHTINGFLCAAIGFSLIDILNRSDMFHIKLTPIFVALVSFCFSMTIGVLWEFFEFGGDQLFKMDMQKDRILTSISSVEINKEKKNHTVIIDSIDKTIIYDKEGEELAVIDGGYLDLGVLDTMKDLIVNFIGAIVFSILGLLYIKNRDQYSFAEVFMPRIKNRN